jgi:hypothetical protein
MVSAAYLVNKHAGPSEVGRIFHQRVLPPVIDVAAQVEAVIERVAQGARRSPSTALVIAFGFGFMAATLRPRH